MSGEERLLRRLLPAIEPNEVVNPKAPIQQRAREFWLDLGPRAARRERGGADRELSAQTPNS